MKLKLKSNAVNIPLDEYSVECPNAFVKDTGVSFDYRNQILNVEWAMYRNEDEANENKKALKQGSYIWTREARPSVYEPDIPATYSAEVPELKDEDGKVTQEYVAPKLLTEAIKGKLLIPRFGAFKDVKNIKVSVDGVDFGTQGNIWIGMHSEWSDYEIVN